MDMKRSFSDSVTEAILSKSDYYDCGKLDLDHLREQADILTRTLRGKVNLHLVNRCANSLSYSLRNRVSKGDMEAHLGSVSHYDINGVPSINNLYCSMGSQAFMGFCVGNIFKYIRRYGKKEGENKSDFLKALHYTTFLTVAIEGYKITKPNTDEQFTW